MRASLRARLVAWLLLPLSLFVAVCAWLSWRNAAAVADYVQDHDLLSSAKVLSDRLIWEGDNVQASVPPSALSLFVSPAHDRVFLSVVGSEGEVALSTFSGECVCAFINPGSSSRPSQSLLVRAAPG